MKSLKIESQDELDVVEAVLAHVKLGSDSKYEKALSAFFCRNFKRDYRPKVKVKFRKNENNDRYIVVK